eukprot:CAMPEP_0201877936 /NCGR_PEP_ID=MMETSP0902-20130614/9222_1 /ASSEMBLY_ACC=CAM_ASM_000551 /TAXON_ID=420261 /ORGANISM="Thalassiosira antarctica, Strain CCMP982" /LENGTH=785 /DNA_ID=CAMNT_0048405479 /DNA_START=36 /DNA_END=2393 /DNA_ORIENTATION=+
MSHSSTHSAAEESNETPFDDDSFVVRRKQSAPDGEEDSSVSTGQLSDNNNKSASSSRSTVPMKHGDTSVSDNDDVCSLAELTAYSTGVDLHPHHKKRRNKEQRHSSTERESDADQRRHPSRSKGVHREGRVSSGRRRKPNHSEAEEEEFYNEDGSAPSSSSRPQNQNQHGSSHRSKRNSRSLRKRSPNSSGGFSLSHCLSRLSSSPAVSAVINFFDGVNLKTILFCIMGMTLVMKLNQRPPSPDASHGITNTAEFGTVAPGVRGAMRNENEGYNNEYAVIGEDKDESDSGTPLYAPAVDETPMQPPPPADPQPQQPVQQQQQLAPYTQQGLVPQQQVAAADPNTPSAYANADVAQSNSYAVGQQSTFNQPPLQQQPPAQPQADQFGSAVDASQMLPPQTAEVVVVADVAQVAAAGAVAQQQPIQAVEVPLVDVAQQPMTQTAEVPLAQQPAAVQGSVLSELNNFKDTWDPYDKTDIPMFWHIPKAGGSSIKDAMGGCHRFVQATEFGITDGHDADTTVAIVYPAVPGVADTDRSPFVNIDSTSVAGIQRAKSMGFADAQLAGVVVSPFVFETNDLFTQTAKGRFFSVFRHPIDRAVSMFYYIRVADWEPTYKPELQEWTLEQYATSDIVENNWMTRQLSNQLGGELTDENLKKAMEVVRTKFLVGLMTQIEPSMTRFEKFFRWTYHVNPPNQEACRERLMSGGSNSNAANKKPVAEGDPAWDLLAQQNNFDLQLYTYIESLFVEQEAFVVGMPDEFRNVDGTCCKCGPPTFPPEGFTCPEAVKNA